MIKKPGKIILAIIVILLLIPLFNIFLNSINYPEYWFIKLSSLSTALAAFGGLCILIVTFLYLLETRKMVQEMQRQKEPAVTIKLIPDKDHFNFFNVLIKNTGGSPAYDITINFNPDLPYADTTLNNVNAIKNLPLLEAGEEMEFFFASAIDYIEKQTNPMTSTVTIRYYSAAKYEKNKGKEFKRIYTLNINERIDQRLVSKKNVNDLVTEIEELKQGLLILLSEMKEEKTKNERKRKYFKALRRRY